MNVTKIVRFVFPIGGGVADISKVVYKVTLPGIIQFHSDWNLLTVDHNVDLKIQNVSKVIKAQYSKQLFCTLH